MLKYPEAATAVIIISNVDITTKYLTMALQFLSLNSLINICLLS